jgi:hypothetical protein
MTPEERLRDVLWRNKDLQPMELIGVVMEWHEQETANLRRLHKETIRLFNESQRELLAERQTRRELPS